MPSKSLRHSFNRYLSHIDVFLISRRKLNIVESFFVLSVKTIDIYKVFGYTLFKEQEGE